jgi:hypothetical protein
MADRLYLSYWTRDSDPVARWRALSKVVELVPYSQLAKAETVVRVYESAHAEPALAERPLAPPFTPAHIQELINEFAAPSACLEVDAFWDLWRWDDDWKLEPSRLLVNCFGPEFDSGGDDHLRLDFGLDAQFLPQPERSGSQRMIESNIRSLLRLVHEIDDAIAAERRLLWSESGENFAGKLQQALESAAGR